MTDKELLQALRATGTDQHRCFGCGHEHRCSTRGCAIHRAAIERIKELLAEVDVLRHPRKEPLSQEEPDRGQFPGCYYCTDDACIPLDWEFGLDHILPGYKFCPMCGRPLTEYRRKPE